MHQCKIMSFLGGTLLGCVMLTACGGSASSPVGGSSSSSGSSSSASTSSSTSSSSGSSSSGNAALDHPFFVGNISAQGEVRSDFIQYWNQITPANEGKWPSVEGTRDVYNWAPLDRVYNYARQNGILFKHHTFVWGAARPSWQSAPQAEIAEEFEEWIRDFCERYPDTELIDVVNEPLPGHAPAVHAQVAFGGNWITRSFQLARQYCPNSVLILNDYDVIRWETDRFIELVRPVIQSGYVDAVGLEAHGLEGFPAADIQQRLDYLWEQLQVPMYITEYDVDLADDAKQLQTYQEQFPVFYNHPHVKGITIYGYIYGKTWRAGTGLIRQDGTHRPAMTWLMNYINENPR